MTLIDFMNHVINWAGFLVAATLVTAEWVRAIWLYLRDRSQDRQKRRARRRLGARLLGAQPIRLIYRALRGRDPNIYKRARRERLCRAAGAIMLACMLLLGPVVVAVAASGHTRDPSCATPERDQ